jgi:SAM-dependent methyltransferase
MVDRFTPRTTRNINARRNYTRFVDELLNASATPRVLVLGGSIVGEGMEPLVRRAEIELVETDVSFGPRTKVICDAHDIPFGDNSFDAVVAQAVLEHVMDPYRCVDEIHRVLKPDGLVYAETPFMQPVHGRCYDFTRFSYLGHRRLFRRFAEIDSGAVCGPGMSLAYSWQYFLWSFSKKKVPRKMLQILARFTAWHWKYFDSFLVRRDASLDSAAGLYFMGRKSERVLSDKELITLYRGGFG